MSVSIPANESGRLEALRRYQILDTAPEVAYDEITELAAQICGCPVAAIGFVDEAQDWKKSSTVCRPTSLDCHARSRSARPQYVPAICCASGT
jgi:adenylate cyclase